MVLNRKKLLYQMGLVHLKDLALIITLIILSYGTAFYFTQDFMTSLISLIFPVFFSFHVKVSPHLLLKMHNAFEVNRSDFPEMFLFLDNLCIKSHLLERPKVFLLRTNKLNAFSIHTGETGIVAISLGIINLMTAKELYSILAHEISHITHKDPLILRMLHAVYSFISFISSIVHILILTLLPFYLIRAIYIDVHLLLVVVFVPFILRLLILAFMRNREFHADFEAVKLTSDPESLAMALEKLQRMENKVLRTVFPVRPHRLLRLLDTHPLIGDRIQRLREISK